MNECVNVGFSEKTFASTWANKEMKNSILTKMITNRNTGHSVQHKKQRNAHLVHTFKRFSFTCRKKISNFDELLLQIKVCSILISISKEISTHSDLFEHIQSDWEKLIFDYPIEQPVQASTNIIELKENAQSMNHTQNIIISLLFNESYFKRKSSSLSINWRMYKCLRFLALAHLLINEYTMHIGKRAPQRSPNEWWRVVQANYPSHQITTFAPFLKLFFFDVKLLLPFFVYLSSNFKAWRCCTKSFPSMNIVTCLNSSILCTFE